MLDSGEVGMGPLVAINDVSVEGGESVGEFNEETGSTKEMYEYGGRWPKVLRRCVKGGMAMAVLSFGAVLFCLQRILVSECAAWRWGSARSLLLIFGNGGELTKCLFYSAATRCQ